MIVRNRRKLNNSSVNSFVIILVQIFSSRVLANRLSLDGQGRLVLRESGKIVLPYEHFANAVMLKHMTGPHGMHLSLDATIRSVMESYTIGRENFGMEKEFIVEVVQSCPNQACRYYKTHLGGAVPPFMDAAFQSAAQSNPDFLQHLQQPPILPQQSVPSSQSSGNTNNSGIIDMTQIDANNAAVSHKYCIGQIFFSVLMYSKIFQVFGSVYFF